MLLPMTNPPNDHDDEDLLTRVRAELDVQPDGFPPGYHASRDGDRATITFDVAEDGGLLWSLLNAHIRDPTVGQEQRLRARKLVWTLGTVIDGSTPS